MAGSESTKGDKYGGEEGTPLLRGFHGAIRRRVAERFEASGGPWESFVFDRSYELVTADLFREVEKEWLDAGHRFDFSAVISPKEASEKYRSLDLDRPARESAAGASKEAVEVGSGDNVVRYEKNVRGVARYVRTSERVMEMLTEGVPEETIAVIDDSGGTLTAPILEDFRGVICMGGTVRSHLGILAREYGIPCLMNARVEELAEGDGVEIEVTVRARSADDYQKGVEVPARIWKLGKE